MSIEVYVFEDEDGVQDSYSTRDPREAREYAQKNSRLWIAQTYEFEDSEMVADFRDKLDTE